MSLNGPDKMDGKSLQTMDTAALRALLLMELSAEGDVNVARIQEISDIIAEREQFEIPDADMGWEDFRKNYESSEPIHTLEQDCSEAPKPETEPKAVPERKTMPKRKAWGRLAVAAAIVASLIVGATLTAQAAEFDLWAAMARWTSETFGFTLGARESMPNEDKLKNEELAPLWDAMLEGGVAEPCLPTYLPDGFEQIELIKNSEEGFWFAAYQSETDLIQIQVHQFQEDWTTFQKDAVDPEIYMWNEMEFYIMENMGQGIATWTSGQYEYAIYGLSKPELYEMIESIHKEEVQ